MKVLLTIIIIFVLSGVYFITANYSPYDTGDAEGEVTILVVDKFGDTVVDDTLPFYEEDTLFGLLETHYDVAYNTMNLHVYNDETGRIEPVSAHIILGIENVHTNFSDAYLRISLRLPVYEDGEIVSYEESVAKVGVDGLPLFDHAVYIFEYIGLQPKGDGA